MTTVKEYRSKINSKNCVVLWLILVFNLRSLKFRYANIYFDVR